MYGKCSLVHRLVFAIRSVSSEKQPKNEPSKARTGVPDNLSISAGKNCPAAGYRGGYGRKEYVY